MSSFTISDKEIWSLFFYLHCGRFVRQSGKETVKYIIENYSGYIYITFSPLFKRITKSIENKGWVDIENEYYTLLSSLPESENSKRAKELNDELDYLKVLLAEYLNSVQDEVKQKDTINQEIQSILLDPIHPEEIAISSTELLDVFIKERVKFDRGEWESFLHLWNEELTTLDYQSSIERIHEDFNKEGAEGIRKRAGWKKFLLPDRMMMLNFNYTTIADDYLSWDKEKYHLINHIHVELLTTTESISCVLNGTKILLINNVWLAAVFKPVFKVLTMVQQILTFRRLNLL